MTSRTPIRLTPHRGPLATPPTSPENSPTTSTPPTEISYCSTAMKPTLDIAILQHQISPQSPPARGRYGSHITRRRRQCRSSRLSPLGLIFEGLIYPTSELARTLAGIVAFCLLVWGVLELSSHASELPQQPRSISRFPLPSRMRTLHCHGNPGLCEPGGQHAAVLHFLYEQIRHAKALSSLGVGLGLPLRAFLEAHQVTIRSVVIHDLAEQPLVQEVDVFANLTESLDSALLDFTPGSFIGRSFTLALEELGDLISEPTVSRASSIREEDRDVHLHAIYWRTASNLLLEYSAARPRAKRLLQHLHTFRRQLSPWVSGDHMARSTEETLNVSWWEGLVRHPNNSVEDEMRALVTGLETTLDNVHRLIAYLDWITEHLAQTSLRDALKIHHRALFSSCTTSLQELFARSRPPTPKKFCFCLSGYGMEADRPERVEIMVPGSPTVRAER